MCVCMCMCVSVVYVCVCVCVCMCVSVCVCSEKKFKNKIYDNVYLLDKCLSLSKQHPSQGMEFLPGPLSSQSELIWYGVKAKIMMMPFPTISDANLANEVIVMACLANFKTKRF